MFQIFDHVRKRLDQKAKVNFKIYDVTSCIINNYNTHIARCLKKQRQSDNEILSVKTISLEIFFLKNHAQNVMERLVPNRQFEVSYSLF